MKHRLSPMAALLGMCGFFMAGCGTTSEDYTEEKSTEDSGMEYAGGFVTGNKAADHGRDIFGYVNGMDIRCLANDSSKIPGAVGDWYFISTSMLNELGALTWSGNTFTAKNFTSPRSGKKYRWMGWTIARSGTPLVLDNPLTLTRFSGTLRSYWATVE
jgi:hypothetical protein